MLIAQITDSHFCPPGQLANGRVDTARHMQRCVEALMALSPRPDLVIFTGDLTDAGTPEAYGALRELLAPLKLPLYVIPGNHDRREALRAAFADHAYLPETGYLNYIVESRPVRLIGLDTLVEGAPSGALTPTHLAFLEAALAQGGGTPTLIFMHHPPFATGLHHIDKTGCAGAREMAAIVARHANVVRVCAGHQHRAIFTGWAGTVASVAPGLAHQLLLDLTPDRHPDDMFMFEPPAFHLHLWHPETGLVTHQAMIDNFEGPYPFEG